MLLAEFLAGCLCVALVAYDWRRFQRLTVADCRYGCPVARADDTVPVEPDRALPARFGPDGLLRLDHGIARLFPDERRVLLHPQSGLGSSWFRTAWPIKGALELRGDRWHCVKLMPWSSAVLTVLWLAVVGIGTSAFVIRFLMEGDSLSLGSLLLVLGVTGVGLLVLAFGLVTVSLAYRLEDQRLMEAYQELRVALSGSTNETR
jgi:hypothetical protein